MLTLVKIVSNLAYLSEALMRFSMIECDGSLVEKIYLQVMGCILSDWVRVVLMGSTDGAGVLYGCLGVKRHNPSGR